MRAGGVQKSVAGSLFAVRIEHIPNGRITERKKKL